MTAKDRGKDIPDTITAKAFQLVDDEGILRAERATQRDGLPQMRRPQYEHDHRRQQKRWRDEVWKP